MHQESRRRTIYLIAISIGLPTLLVVWWLQHAIDPFVRVAHPLLMGYLAWAVIALKRERVPLKVIEQATFWVNVAFWYSNFAYSLISGHTFTVGWAEVMSVTMLNFFILAVLSHLVFSTRFGGRVNLGLLGLSALIGVGGLLPDVMQGQHQQELTWLIHFELAFAVLIGFIYVVAKSKDDYTEAALHAQNLHTMAYEDALTGLPNRRRVEGELDWQIEISGRYGRPLSLISFDLDKFKSINDTLGHAVGDEVLTSVARLVKPLLRASDTLGRWGGEEFVIVVPESDLEHASAFAERIRTAIQHAQHPHGLGVTASFGVVTWEPGMSAQDLLEVADRRLYQAKAGGRNRVAVGA